MLSWFSNLQVRLTLGFAVILTLSIASVSFYSAYVTRIETERFAAEIELARAKRAEQLVRDTFEANQNWDEVQYAIQQVGNLFGWRVVIESDNGLIVADSHELVRNAQGLFDTFAERFVTPTRFTKRPVVVNGELIGHLLVDERPNIRERPLSIREFYTSQINSLRGQHRSATVAPSPRFPPIATQIPSKTTEDLVAEVLEYVDPPLSNLHSSFQRSLLIAGFAAGVAGLLIVVMFTRQALAPVRGLTAAARRLGSGDLSQRVAESGNDDIGELARTFNTMASDLELARQQHRQLTADVAHELRTPLTNIQGYLEGIKDRVVNPDAEIIDTLHSETIHLAKLVEDLRILAVADAGALVLDKIRGSAIPVVEDVVAIFAQRAREKQIELSIQKTGTDPVLDFDHTRMRQIVTNLIENALTHTPNNGAVKVEIRGSSENFILSVSDSGSGISEDDLPRIFDQFFRTDRSRNRATGGAGLGLTIVKRLVESHGGFVAVTSKTGEGATFAITLPIRQG